MSSYKYLSLYLILISGSFAYSSEAPLQCLDEDGQPVDWFVVYKIPKISDESPYVSDGTDYMFITPSTEGDGWTQSELPITSKDSIAAKTLQPLYDNNEEEFWMIYNDQYKGISWLSGAKFGHTKGVVGANENGGFWLIHSVPKFPPLDGEYSYPDNGHRFGQSMLCISLPPDQIDLLGKIFMYNKPQILEKRMGAQVAKLYPHLASAAKGEIIKKAPWKLSTTIQSAGGKKFVNFAKAPKFHNDLYEWVAEALQTDMLAETWMNEAGPLPSSCNRYKVLNVEEIEFKDQSLAFSSHKDHSKWAISNNVHKPWVCIGDINRATPQEKRAGGTMCFEDKTLWKAYNTIVAKYKTCKSSKHYQSINNV